MHETLDLTDIRSFDPLLSRPSERVDKDPVTYSRGARAEFDWDENAVERLRRMYLDENATADSVARRLGTTRGSVNGKIRKLGWTRAKQSSRE